MSMFKNQVETQGGGMCASTNYYYIEEIYQAFKERLLGEVSGEVIELRKQLAAAEARITALEPKPVTMEDLYKYYEDK